MTLFRRFSLMYSLANVFSNGLVKCTLSSVQAESGHWTGSGLPLINWQEKCAGRPVGGPRKSGGGESGDQEWRGRSCRRGGRGADDDDADPRHGPGHRIAGTTLVVAGIASR